MSGEIVYLRGSTAARTDLIVALDDKGYEVSVLRTYQQVLDRVQRSQKIDQLIVDASTSEGETSSRVVELRDTEPLFRIPVIMIGVRAKEKTELLKEQYSCFRAYDVPVRLTELVNCVLQNTPPPVGGETGSAKGTKGEKKDTKASDEDSFGGALFRDSSFVEHVPQASNSLTAEAQELTDFDDESIVPPHVSRSRVISYLRELNIRSHEVGVQSRRTSIISDMVSRVFSLGDARQHVTRTSALLLNSGFLDGNMRNAVVDLMNIAPSEQEVSSSGFEKSAEFAKREVSDHHVSRVLRAVADIIENGSSNEESEILEEAECVLISEIMSRACWTAGSWDNFGAYRFAKFVRKSALNVTKNAGARALVRILIRMKFGNVREAIEAESTNEVLVAAVRDAEATYPSRKTRRVQLHEITSGMRLARPLVSRDGRLVVPAGVVFDNDLAWKVWQLSLVRPLCIPLIICRSD